MRNFQLNTMRFMMWAVLIACAIGAENDEKQGPFRGDSESGEGVEVTIEEVADGCADKGVQIRAAATKPGGTFEWKGPDSLSFSATTIGPDKKAATTTVTARQGGYYKVGVAYTLKGDKATAKSNEFALVEVRITSGGDLALMQDKEHHKRSFTAEIKPDDRHIQWKTDGPGQEFLAVSWDGDGRTVKTKIKTPVSQHWNGNSQFLLIAHDSELPQCKDELVVELIKFKRGGECSPGSQPVAVMLSEQTKLPEGDGHAYVQEKFDLLGKTQHTWGGGRRDSPRQWFNTGRGELQVYYSDQADQCLGGDWRFEHTIQFRGSQGIVAEHRYGEDHDSVLVVACAVGAVVGNNEVSLTPTALKDARRGEKVSWQLGLGISADGGVLSVGVTITPGDPSTNVVLKNKPKGSSDVVFKGSSHQAGSPISEHIAVKTATIFKYKQMFAAEWVFDYKGKIQPSLVDAPKTLLFEPQDF